MSNQIAPDGSVNPGINNGGPNSDQEAAHFTKEEIAQALRGMQAALDAAGKRIDEVFAFLPTPGSVVDFKAILEKLCTIERAVRRAGWLG